MASGPMWHVLWVAHKPGGGSGHLPEVVFLLDLKGDFFWKEACSEAKESCIIYGLGMARSSSSSANSGEDAFQIGMVLFIISYPMRIVI